MSTVATIQSGDDVMIAMLYITVQLAPPPGLTHVHGLCMCVCVVAGSI